jgi:AcrR family transcriptional regulator
MADEKRSSRFTKRTAEEEGTRRRITESALALHGTLGPARTSLSAVAEHAGVRRATLHRHFADEAALLAACTAHWGVTHPPPDPGPWASIADPHERLAVALMGLYAYYRGIEGMLANVLRDEPVLPTVARMLAGYRDYLAAVQDVLVTGRPLGGSARAATGHALAFATWRSLTREQGLDDTGATELMCRLVAVA